MGQLPKRYQKIADALIVAYHKKRLSHAVLFYGPKGVGKNSIIQLLLRELMGPEWKNHPDILHYECLSSTSQIDSIRAVTSFFATTPFIASQRIAILRSFHLLSRQAQNALLKTLEEPPDNSFLFLTADDLAYIPATIISRVISISVPLLSKKDLFATNIAPGTVSNTLFKISHGNIGLLNYLLTQDGIQSYKENEAKILQLINGDISSFAILDTLFSAEKSDQETSLAHWMAWLHLLIRSDISKEKRTLATKLLQNFNAMRQSKISFNFRLQLEKDILCES